MMGYTHALTGAAGGVGAAMLADHALSLPVPPSQLALAAVLGAGFAVWPDMDHPGSGIARCMGPVSAGIAWAVSRMSGGHRNGTHSFAGAAAFTLLAFEISAVYTGQPRQLALGAGLALAELSLGWLVGRRLQAGRKSPAAYRQRWHGWAAGLALVALYATVGAAGLLWGRPAGAWMMGALIALSLAGLLRAWLPVKKFFDRLSRVGRTGVLDELLPFAAAAWLVLTGVDLSLVPYALTFGVLMHLAGDIPTIQGCPLGWPWSQKQVRLPEVLRFTTGGPQETIIGWVLIVATAAMLVFGLDLPELAAFGAH